jgi:hypothetical protein
MYRAISATSGRATSAKIRMRTDRLRKFMSPHPGEN